MGWLQKEVEHPPSSGFIEMLFLDSGSPKHFVALGTNSQVRLHLDLQGNEGNSEGADHIGLSNSGGKSNTPVLHVPIP